MTRQQKIGLGVAAAVVALIYLAGGGRKSPPGTGEAQAFRFNCHSIAGQVTEMSKGKDPEILELSDVEQTESGVDSVTCHAKAEWSRGEGLAEFGAHKSDGGSIILNYKQL